MRYINHKKLSVGLPLAFSLAEYKRNLDSGHLLHRAIYRDPLEFNEEFITLKDDHILKIYWRNKMDAIYFEYLIRDLIIHQYVDEFTYKDPAMTEIVRTVDGRLRFYCWKIGNAISYQRVPLYRP